MKKLLRSDAVQNLLGWLLGIYIRLILNTVRWTHENLDCVEPVLAGDAGAVALFWHGRIPLCLATAPQWWRKKTKALISPSSDGQFIATALDIERSAVTRHVQVLEAEGFAERIPETGRIRASVRQAQAANAMLQSLEAAVSRLTETRGRMTTLPN